MNNAHIIRTDGAWDSEPVQIWPDPPADVDVTSGAVQAAAVAAFLDPANCDADHYLVASVRLQQHGEGYVTIATIEWDEGIATVRIQEPGKPDVLVPRSDTTAAQAAIAAKLTSLLDGTDNRLPGSAYRSGQ